MGGVLTVPPLYRALEERIDYPVSPSTMYRMPARHGWRKVQPDTYHLKADPQAIDDFKKKFCDRLFEVASVAGGRPLRVMFQDEVRFGRMSDF